LFACGLLYVFLQCGMFFFKNKAVSGWLVIASNPEIAVIVPHPAKRDQVPVAVLVKYTDGLNVSFGMLLAMISKIIDSQYVFLGYPVQQFLNVIFIIDPQLRMAFQHLNAVINIFEQVLFRGS